jgi:glycosyltransferase involved in cell wall biosynthesis
MKASRWSSLEAAACNVPIVAFDVGGVREILGDAPSAALVRLGDLTHFAAE